MHCWPGQHMASSNSAPTCTATIATPHFCCKIGNPASNAAASLLQLPEDLPWAESLAAHQMLFCLLLAGPGLPTEPNPTSIRKPSINIAHPAADCSNLAGWPSVSNEVAPLLLLLLLTPGQHVLPFLTTPPSRPHASPSPPHTVLTSAAALANLAACASASNAAAPLLQLPAHSPSMYSCCPPHAGPAAAAVAAVALPTSSPW